MLKNRARIMHMLSPSIRYGWHCLIQHYGNKAISNTISNTMHHRSIRERKSLEYLLRVNDLQLASVFPCSRDLRLLLTITIYYLIVVVSTLLYSFVAAVVSLPSPCCEGALEDLSRLSPWPSSHPCIGIGRPLVLVVLMHRPSFLGVVL